MLQVDDILYSLLLFQALLFGLYMLARKSQKALPLFFIVLSLHMASNLAEKIFPSVNISAFTPVYALLYGPLMFAFIRGFIYQQDQYQRSDLLHLAPSFLTLIAIITNMDIDRLVPLVAVSLFSYLFAAFKLLRRYHNIIENTQSVGTIINLRWVNHLLIGFLSISLLDIASQLLPLGYSTLKDATHYLTIAGFLGLVTHLFYKALSYPDIFAGITKSDEKINQDQNDKYAKSILTDADLNQIATEISSLVTEENLYLAPRLSLHDLAKKSGTSARHISQAINQTLGITFSDLINSHRIKHAKALMKNANSTTMSLLQIAFDSGFNSKTSFNDAFRKQTEITPGTYRKQLKNNS